MTTIERWQQIKALDSLVESRLKGDLAAVDALHGSWLDFADSLDEVDRTTLRRRTLRKHAIETGILERLYDIDWGLTEALVADGLTREAVARAGSDLPPGVLPMLEAQLAGVEMVADYVRRNVSLTTSFVKELHALITRAQTHYDATDALGRQVRAELLHGGYKTLPNNVRRGDDSILEFAPPEQVPGEIERLVSLYNEMGLVHPVVAAAWLHHRFVQIHPFQDGNGRVARALTLLSLERKKYPPMVVDRDSRDRYLRALDIANSGDLAPLGKLFAKLVMRSIRRELQEPIPQPVPRTAREVARAFARSLERREHEEADQRTQAVHLRAQQIHGRLKNWFEEANENLREDFREAGRRVHTRTEDADPEDPDRSKYWHYQIIQTAKRAEHFAVMSADRWWTSLGMTVNGHRMRFVASIHHVGSLRTGIMAITTFATIEAKGQEYAGYQQSFVSTSMDAFTFSHDEEVEDRAQELYDWLDESLAVALQRFMRRTVGFDKSFATDDWVQTVTEAILAAARIDSWAYLADVGNRIRHINPSFDPARYGSSTLSQLIRSRSDLFETCEETPQPGGPSHIRVRIHSATQG
ncbi:MAG: hypothetical protein F4Z17_11625 [Acidimicrobiia bacterium]|nr:hypothetical protein [Acidimicrobiia bacterium]